MKKKEEKAASNIVYIEPVRGNSIANLSFAQAGS